MLDFTPFFNGEISLFELVQREGLRPADLRRLTHEMIDTILSLIASCADEDVTYVPSDPDAYDEFAATKDELQIPWTLGHVIVHTTASAEESAAIAAELARGVPYRGGRSRYEVPWQSITTIAQCQYRLQESRRMRLASLEMWPEPPHLENTYEPRKGITHNAISRFVSGLAHDADHLEQIRKIVEQSHSVRA